MCSDHHLQPQVSTSTSAGSVAGHATAPFSLVAPLLAALLLATASLTVPQRLAAGEPTEPAEADIILSQSTEAETVAAGGQLTYTITVTNNGPADATEVVVTDTLPANTTLVASEGCVEDPSAEPDCTLGTLAAGVMSSFTLTVDVPQDAVGVLSNVAEAETATADPNPGNNDATLITGVVRESDLGILISDAPDPVVASGLISYLIDVVNNGPSDANGVQVTDALPEGVVIESTNGCAEDPNASPTCSLGDLAAGDSVSYTLEARVDPGSVGELANTVTVSSLAADPNTDNNSAAQTTTAFAEADLDVRLSAEPDTVIAGENLIFTVFVENNGPSHATAVQADLLLPPEVTLVSSSGCAEDPMAVPTCSLGDLVVGATTFYQVTVNVATATLGTITTQVFVSNGATDPDSGNNEASFDTTVISEADLVVSKTDNTTTAVPGESLTYVIEVRNDGPSDAIDVDVIDPFPVSLDCIWQCAPESGATCTGGQIQADLIDTIALPALTGVTYTAVCQIDPAASGTLANTVRVSYPGIDPDLLDNSASDLDTVLQGRADLRLEKTDGITLTAPGQTVTYTIQVFNDGPSDALGSRVTDTLPVALEDVTWTCSATGSSACTSSGVGDLDDSVQLRAGDQLTYLVSGTVRADASGHLVNTAQVAVAEGLVDPNPNNNSDTDFDTEITDVQADLRISKTDGVVTATPGGSVTYTIVVTNEGPQAVNDARVQDAFPAPLSCIWSCEPSAGASCTPGQIAGDIDHLADLPATASVTYTAQCAIDGAASGSLSNTATVTPPAAVLDPDLIDNSASDLDTVLSGRANLRITKTDGTTLTAPGQTLTYTLQVFNDGPSDVTGARVQDAFSAAVEDVLWTCTATGTSTCTAAGAGDLDDSVNLRAGDQLTYVATATVAAGATGTLLNTATVTPPEGVEDPNGNDNTAVDFDTVVTDVLADLSISKTDGVTQATPGDSVTYTLVASNAGPNDVLGATVQDLFPPELTCIWSCLGEGGAQCAAGQVAGDIVQTVDLPVAATATFQAVCEIDPAASGTLSNTATIALPPGAVDPDPLDNSAADLDTVLGGRANLSISKTDTLTVTSPGEEITYLITVRNDGPSDVTGATVTDTFPTDLEDVSWLCTAGGGASCASGGVDSIAETVDLPAGASLIFQASATVAEGATGNLENTARVDPPEGVVDPDLNDNTAIDFDTEISDQRGDLSISKTDNTTVALPGGTITYDIVVGNAGPAPVTGARVGDVFPPSLSCLWTCTPEGGAQCTAGQVAGNIDHLVNLPVGASATYRALCTIDEDAAGTLANTATISAPAEIFDPNLLDNSASDLDTVLQSPQVDLSLTVDDGTGQAVPGQAVTYTLIARNDPPLFALVRASQGLDLYLLDPATGEARRRDDWQPDPSHLAAGCRRLDVSGGSEPALTCDDGPQDDPFRESLTVRHPLRHETYSLTTAGPRTVLQRRSEKESCPGCLLDSLAIALPVEVSQVVDLAFAPPPQNLSGIQVQDLFPSVLTCQWTCQASLGSGCTAGPVVGDIQDTVSLASGGQLTYSAQCDVDSAAVTLLGGGDLVNSAQLLLPAGVDDIDTANNGASDTDTLAPRGDLAITKSDGRTSVATGEALTYTLRVHNPGPSDVSGAVVNDDFSTLPLSNVFWTCTASVGSVCSAAGVQVLQDTVTIAAGGTLTFLATGTVNGGATGVLVNSATVDPPAGYTDPIANNNTALDFDTVIGARSDLALSISDGVTSAVPGETLTYVLTVANGGPSDVFGAVVRDTFPPSLEAVTWTCQASPGSTCTAAGSGSIDDTVDLRSGGLMTFTAQGTIAPSARGTLANTATVSIPFGTVDPNPSDNTASDFDTTLTPRVDLSLSKTDAVTSAVPGDMVTYTLAASNAGPSDVVAARLVDDFPATLDCLWTCVGSGGGICTPGQVAGDIDDTVDLPVASAITYTAVCEIDPAARGTLVNHASIEPPGDTQELRPGDNTSSDLDTVLTPQADLAVSKSDGLTQAAPGTSLTYDIVVTNHGPSSVDGALLEDTLPTSLEDALWTCEAGSGASCVAAGAGDLAERVDLGVGASATFRLAADIAPSAVGTLSNTASISPPAGVVDGVASNDQGTDDDTLLVAEADLRLSKSDGVTSAIPGQSVTYTLTVVNDGPSDVLAATVSDVFADDLSCQWGCTGDGGGLCNPGPVTGNIDDSVDLPVDARITYTAICEIAADATGTLSNTATVNVPDGATDPVPSNNTDSDMDTVLTTRADLTISKTDGQTSATPGDSVTYTIVAANEGPGAVVGAQVTDLFPTDLDCTWTCLPVAGATCQSGPVTGNLVDTVDLAVASRATYTAECVIAADATGVLSNTARIEPPTAVEDPDPSDNQATDGDTALTLAADLSLTLSDGVSEATPGESVTYTLVVGNDGPNGVFGARVEDLFPDELSCLWGCVGTAGASCTPGQVAGDLIDSVDLPVAASATYTIVCQIDPAAQGTLSNSASIVPPPEVTELQSNNNTASDLDTQLIPRADLRISKSDGVSTATPGGELVYDIVVTNPEGPSTIADARVEDLPPASLDCVWTCAGSDGGQCSAGPMVGDLVDAATLPPGGRVTYRGLCAIDPLATGTLSNTATVAVTAPSSDPNAANDQATDNDTVLVPQVDLSLGLDDGQTTAVPGTTVRYTLTARHETPLFALWRSPDDGTRWLKLRPRTGTVEVLGHLPRDLCHGLHRGDDGLLTTHCSDGSGAWHEIRLARGVDGGPQVTRLALHGDAALDVSLEHLDGAAAAQADAPLSHRRHRLETRGAFLSLEAVDPGDGSWTEVSTFRRPASLADSGTATGLVFAEMANVQGALVQSLFPATLQCQWTCQSAGDGSCSEGPVDGDLQDTVDLGIGAQLTYDIACQVDAGATGSLIVSGEIFPPDDVVEIDGSNNAASDQDTLTPTADLAISKSDGVTAAIPGESVTYTLVAGNPAGPSNIVDARVVDLFNPSISCLWTCQGDGGGRCTPGQEAGDIVDPVDLPVGATVTYTAVCGIASNASGNLTNSAEVRLPAGSIDPNANNNSASDLDTQLVPTADLSLSKSDGVTNVAAGGSVTYDIVARHLGGPSDLQGVRVEDLFAPVLDCLWTCSPDAGASCAGGQSSGDLVDFIDLPVGSQVTYQAVCQVASGASGSLVNTATLTLPPGSADTDSSNNSATDADTVVLASADLSISKSNGGDTVTPGAPVIYDVIVSNGGPSDVVGAAVNDPLPASLEDCQWTCTASAGASCTAGPVLGDLIDSPALPTGAAAHYEITCTLADDASGQLLNQATVAAPAGVDDANPNNNSATDLDTVFLLDADIVLSKSDGVDQATPGGELTYLLVASNPDGPADLPGVRIQDTPPTELECLWTCTAVGGATCSAVAQSGTLDDLLDLPVGGRVTYSGTCQIDPRARGTLSNTAQLILPVGASDPDESNNSASDTDTILLPAADLQLSKSDGVDQAVPGASLTYAIELSNPGPSALTAATVSDPFPAALTCTWSCVASSGGATCDGTGGSGDLADTVDLPVDSSATYAAACDIDSQATGTLSNTVTVNSEAGIFSTSDQTQLVPTADLSIAKSDGVGSAVPGQSVTYSIVVRNDDGPSAITHARVVDAFPASTTCTWNCAADDGATCAAAGQSGDLDDLVDLPVGTGVTYTAGCQISSGASGSLVNTATVAVPTGSSDPQTSNNSSTAVTQLVGSNDLSLSKSGDPASVFPGGELVYTLTVFNGGPSNASSITLVDTLPDGVEFQTATSTGFSTSASAGMVFRDGFESGNLLAWGADGGGPPPPDPTEPCSDDAGVVSCQLGGLLSGSSGIVTLTTRVAADTPSGSLINQATVSSFGSDPNSANDTATATTTVGSSDTDLGIVVADDPDPVAAGEDLFYTLTVTNEGPAAATGVRAVDNLPPEVTLVSATPSAGTCGNDVGVVTCDLGEMAVDAEVEIVLWVLVSPDATSALTNRATVSADPVDPNPVNDIDAETTTIAGGELPSIGPTRDKVEAPPVEIPTLSTWGLILSILILGGVATGRVRQRRRGRGKVSDPI